MVQLHLNSTERTEWNIRDANATLIVLNKKETEVDTGTVLTIRKATKLQKPLKIVYISEEIHFNIFEILGWINVNEVSILNIAGPRESNCPGIYVKT